MIRTVGKDPADNFGQLRDQIEEYVWTWLVFGKGRETIAHVALWGELQPKNSSGLAFVVMGFG